MRFFNLATHGHFLSCLFHFNNKLVWGCTPLQTMSFADPPVQAKNKTKTKQERKKKYTLDDKLHTPALLTGSQKERTGSACV